MFFLLFFSFSAGSLASSKLTPEQTILYSTTFIQTSSQNGTGFVWKRRDGYNFIVTCRDVLKGASFARFSFSEEVDKLAAHARTVPKMLSKCDLFVQDIQKVAVYHPSFDVNLVIIPFAKLVNRKHQLLLTNVSCVSGTLFRTQIGHEIVPTAEQAASISFDHPLTFVGYPFNLFEPLTMLPLISRGFIASPFNIKWDGKAQFLIDSKVPPSSSGSPVFLIENMPQEHGTKLLFLGVLNSTLPSFNNEATFASVMKLEILQETLKFWQQQQSSE